MSTNPPTRRGRSRIPGVVLGIGLGGFVDGFLLHQILHWHNMGSAKLPPVTLDAMQQNMRWDGLFHAFTWVVTVLGVYLLLGDARSGRVLPDYRVLTGQLVLGWGVFNLVEGLIDHVILGIHHVRDLPVHVPAYDWIFLLVGGVGYLVVGFFITSETSSRAQRGT
jgi:uncharacterized membrane protein